MKLLLAAQGITPRDRKAVTYELERILPGLARRIGSTMPEEPILRAKLSTSGSAEFPTYHLTLSIRLPDHTAVVQKKDNDLRTLVDLVETSLKKELRRVKARIRRDHLSKRRRGTREAIETFVSHVPKDLPAPPPTAEADENPIFDRLRPLLTPVYTYARELIRSGVLAGELQDDYLSPGDLVDGAVVALAEDAANSLRDPERLERMLYQHVEKAVADEIARHNPGNAAMVSLDSSGAEAESAAGDPERDEVEYYQPFQALRMEDVLIDEHAGDPEHILSDQEEHRVILKFLANHSPRARGAFFLNRMEGFEPFEIAMIQGRDEGDVRADIDDCVRTLQDGWMKVINGGAVKVERAKARV